MATMSGATAGSVATRDTSSTGSPTLVAMETSEGQQGAFGLQIYPGAPVSCL